MNTPDSNGRPVGTHPATDLPPTPPPHAPAPTVIVKRRSSVGAWLLALIIGAALAVLALQALQDPRSVGTQLDDAVATVRAAGDRAGERLNESQTAVADASGNAVAGVGTAISDTGITLKVKAALATDPALSAARIDVDTVGGIVRLSGPAPDATARERATVLAAAPPGVRGVDNRLTLPQQAGAVAAVAPTVAQAVPAASAAPVSLDGPAPEDRAVSARVNAVLGGEAVLASHKIIVSTRQGVVRMEGVVPDSASRELATALAASQQGVKSVDNRLLTTEAATLLARTPQPE